MNDYICACIVQFAGDRGAYATRSTGNEHHLVMQHGFHGVSL
jgi:hypothetical protein